MAEYKKKVVRKDYFEMIEIYTVDGWKRMKDIKEGDNVLTLQPFRRKCEVKPVLKVFDFEYNNDIFYHITNNKKTINDYAIPNQYYPLFNRKNYFNRFWSAEDICNGYVYNINHKYIPAYREWHMGLDGIIELSEFKNDNRGIYLREKRMIYEQIEQEFYGKIIGIEVENKIWYVRQNGKCHWFTSIYDEINKEFRQDRIDKLLERKREYEFLFS